MSAHSAATAPVFGEHSPSCVVFPCTPRRGCRRADHEGDGWLCSVPRLDLIYPNAVPTVGRTHSNSRSTTAQLRGPTSREYIPLPRHLSLLPFSFPLSSLYFFLRVRTACPLQGEQCRRLPAGRHSAAAGSTLKGATRRRGAARREVRWWPQELPLGARPRRRRW